MSWDVVGFSMSAKEWALDTADMGWRFLVNLDSTIEENMGKLPNGAATHAGCHSLTSTDEALSENSQPLLVSETDISIELPRSVISRSRAQGHVHSAGVEG